MASVALLLLAIFVIRVETQLDLYFVYLFIYLFIVLNKFEWNKLSGTFANYLFWEYFGMITHINLKINQRAFWHFFFPYLYIYKYVGVFLHVNPYLFKQNYLVWEGYFAYGPLSIYYKL